MITLKLIHYRARNLKMKYIQERAFVDRKGDQVLIPIRDPNGKESIFEPTVGWVFHAIVEGYTASDKLELTNAEIRKQWKVLDIFEQNNVEEEDGKIQDGEYFAFEDEDFNLLKRLVLFFGPKLGKPLGSNSPLLEDILDEAVNELPVDEDEKEEETAPKKVKKNKVETVEELEEESEQDFNTDEE
jgi:hypothetical protein